MVRMDVGAQKSMHGLKEMDWKLPRSSQQSAWPPSVSGAFSSLIRRELALRVDFADFALAFHYKM